MRSKQVQPRRRVHSRSKSCRVLRTVACETLEGRSYLAANLVISEFLASNNNSIKDSLGNRDDWVELHNAGDAAANLNDYYLTDNASEKELYRLPSQTLAAGAYVLVYADGTNQVTAAGEIHSNFKISASGEYLGLIKAADDSVQFEYAPSFPAQTADISYGLFNADDPNSTRIFFETPTPGAVNKPAAASTTYSVAGKTFAGTLSVTLSDSTPNSTIYYTTDGTVPTTGSTVYTAPFSLTNSTMLRTIVSATGGYATSPVTSQSYIALDATASTTNTAKIGTSTVSGFSSNLPIVMIDTFGTTISDTTDNAASISFIDTTNGTASALGTENYDGRTGFRVRGSTSETYAKQQYALELWDETNNDKKVSLLGLPAQSDWILYAPYTEKTMMQNALAYQWANETGHYASRTRFVELFLNTSKAAVGNGAAPTTSADYAGIYILEEKVKVDSNRVDLDEISPTNPGGGYIIGKDRTDLGTESNFTTTLEKQTFDNTDPDIHDVSTLTTLKDANGNYETEKTVIANNTNALETALFASDFNDPSKPDYYGNYINVGSFVDYYLVNEMAKNIDSFWLSTFYNKAADTTVNGVTTRGLLSAGPVWDFNLALGAPNYQNGANSAGWDTDTLSTAQDPYFKRLLTDPNFVQKVADRWEDLRSTVFSTSNLMANIDSDVALLANGTTNYPVGATPAQPATNPIVRNFIRWPELGNYVTTEGFYDPNGNWIQEVNLMKNWLTARVNWIDSQFVPKATVTAGGTFGSATTVTMSPNGPALSTDTTLLAEGASENWYVPSASYPATGWTGTNYTYPASPAAATWTSGVGGVGYDTQLSPVNFLPYIGTGTTPTNTQASAVQTKMLGVNPSVYARWTFNVSDPNALGALILKMRYDDGFIAWINGVRVIDANSPENVNPLDNSGTVTTPGYRLATSGGSSGDDTQAITQREFNISSVKNLLLAGTNVLAVQELNSGSSSNDALISPMLVSRVISNPTAGSVYYTTDGSDPRASGGGISGAAMLYSTALTINATTKILARTLVNGVWGGLVNNIYNFGTDPLRITELQYDPPDSSNYEFIKVQNIDTAPLNLSGYNFTNGVGFSFPNVTLAAGASGVIVHDLTSFTARYGTQFNVLGSFTGSLDNSGETVAFADGFGTTVQSFKYSPSWYPNTVGLGAALQIVDPAGDKANWSVAAGWKQSYDDAPPVVSATSVGTNSSFNVDVNFVQKLGAATNMSGLVITNTSTGATIDNSTVTAATKASDLLLSFGGFANGVLPDGKYTATLPAGAVMTASGVPMSKAYTFNFSVLAGDLNHDGSVDISDLSILASSFGASGKTFAQGDCNYDGTVDLSDLTILATNFGKVLA